MTLASVTVSLRLIARLPLSTTLPVPMVPVVPPLPICKRAGTDRRGAGVGVGAGEGRGAGPDLGEGAGAADGTRDVKVVTAIEHEGTIVDEVARAQRARVPPLPICKVPALMVVVPV